MSKMIFMCLLSFLSQLAFAAEVPEKEAKTEWIKFKTKYNRRYGGPEDDSRYVAFKKNLGTIQELNIKNQALNGDKPFGVTQFSDLSGDEFKKILLTYKDGGKGKVALAKLSAMTDKEIPASFNWSEKGALTPIKDQGKCGSCWSFAVVENLESTIFIKKGVLPILSSQQVTSCSTKDSGCQGGDIITALDYITEKGVQSESSYPYTSGSGETGACTYDTSQVVAKISGYRFAIPPCIKTADLSCQDQAKQEKELQKQIATVGPASICVDASSWQNYSGGVIAPESCESDWSSMDHCVQLTGYATTEKGVKYWLVRNQWGVGFGEKGFMKLQMGANTCGLANEPTFIEGAEFSGDVTPPPIPTPPPSP